MADFAALGGTSETLRTLLRDRMELPATMSAANFRITVSTPTEADEETAPSAEDPRINLFLYRVTENGYLKNHDLPGDGHPGAYGRPSLSLDLHYLLIPYGSSLEDVHHNEIRAQQLLGSAMRVLHDHPIITESLLTINDPVGSPILDPSLREESESVKLYLDPVDLEDLSKVWTALTLRYRLSVAYVVSVVQIESRKPKVIPPLVSEPPDGGPQISVVEFKRPHISSLRVRRSADPSIPPSLYPYARIGDTVVLDGDNLDEGEIVVWIGSLGIPGATARPGAVEMEVPDDALPDGTPIPEEERIAPGAHPVRVELKAEGLALPGSSSNTVVLMVVPKVDAISAAITATNRSMTIEGSRLYAEDLGGETLIGDARIEKDDYTTAAEDEIVVPLPDTLPDDLCRALVSGDLSTFPSLPSAPMVQMTIGSEGPFTVTLGRRPNTIEEAAPLLQAGIRRVPNAGPAFRGAKVGVVGQRLAIVPGGLRASITVQAGTTANDLRLTATRGAGGRTGSLTGALTFPLASLPETPSITASFGGTAHEVVLTGPFEDAKQVAQSLEAGLRGAGPETAYTGARVGALGRQLFVLPGTSGAFAFSPTASDDATVAALQLTAAYPVRVRVNGLENIDPQTVVLPR